MLREILLGLTCVVVFAYGLDVIFAYLDDPREPPRVSPTIPIVGHVVGFLYYGFDYYDILSQKTNEEVYAIGVLGFKVYITHAIRLTNVIQKTRSLSTKPFLRLENKIHSDASNKAHALFDGPLLEAFRMRTRKALAPGPSLDNLSLRIGEESLHQISALLKQGEVGLLEWTKHITVQITSITLFGALHPFGDPEMVDAMWTWEDYRPSHQIGTDFWHRGYKARTKVYRAFQRYLQDMPDDISFVIRERQEVLREGGMDEEDIAKTQAFFSDAYYNVVPTLFWTIYEAYSRPELLQDIRDEVNRKARLPAPELGSESSVIDIAALKTKCSILLSTYQEVQRTRHAQATSRMVVEDTLLDGRYLLKKGHYFQMPVQPVHRNADIWGPSADVFDPYRFVPSAPGEAVKVKVQPNSFLPWGAAPYTCPARQFVSTEVLVIAALLIVQVDLQPLRRGGWERDPELRRFEKPTLSRPKKDVQVNVVPRKGAGDWKIVLGQSKARIPLASG
ncbi:cytochrome P450 [Xylariaceae sp. FL0016]|nr:cytochrome P450 [Xylariaceae sp. FL0016]